MNNSQIIAALKEKVISQITSRMRAGDSYKTARAAVEQTSVAGAAVWAEVDAYFGKCAEITAMLEVETESFTWRAHITRQLQKLGATGDVTITDRLVDGGECEFTFTCTIGGQQYTGRMIDGAAYDVRAA